MEYNVELVKSTIKKLNASIDVDETATYQIDVENSASVYEPNDETDPTVMVQTESIMKDSSNKCINIHMVKMIVCTNNYIAFYCIRCKRGFYHTWSAGNTIYNI